MKRIKRKLAAARAAVAITLKATVIIYGPGDWVITALVSILAVGLGMVYLPLPMIILPTAFLGYEIWKRLRNV